jgi:ATP-dependent Clp protease, protease subunit
MIHRTSFSPMGATADRLQAAANAALLDDQRTEKILHDCITSSEEQWKVHKVADLWLSAEEALKAGIVTDIADFAPPPLPNSNVLSICPPIAFLAPLRGGAPCSHSP